MSESSRCTRIQTILNRQDALIYSLNRQESIPSKFVLCFWLRSPLVPIPQVWLLLQGLKALYPPSGGPDSVQVVASDLCRLDPDEFLNDTIIDFFIKYSPASNNGVTDH